MSYRRTAAEMLEDVTSGGRPVERTCRDDLFEGTSVRGTSRRGDVPSGRRPVGRTSRRVDVLQGGWSDPNPLCWVCPSKNVQSNASFHCCLASLHLLSLSSAVGRQFWFQPDGPGVGGHDIATAMDAAGVNALIELVCDDAEISFLHDDVAGDGGQDLLAVFIPAGDASSEETDQHVLNLIYLLNRIFSASNYSAGNQQMWYRHHTARTRRFHSYPTMQCSCHDNTHNVTDDGGQRPMAAGT